MTTISRLYRNLPRIIFWVVVFVVVGSVFFDLFMEVPEVLKSVANRLFVILASLEGLQILRKYILQIAEDIDKGNTPQVSADRISVELYLRNKQVFFEQRRRNSFVPMSYIAFRTSRYMSHDYEFDNFEEIVTRFRRAVVVGLPGVGKTMVLMRIFDNLASQYLATGTGPIPIWIDLNKADNPIEAQKLIEHWIGSSDKYHINTSLESMFALNPPVLLFDGLNEMPFETRHERASSLNEWIGRHPEVSVIITSRIHDYLTDTAIRLDSRLHTIKVLPFSDQQVEKFLSLTINDYDLKLYVTNRILKTEALASLARIPLNLSMLSELLKWIHEYRKPADHPKHNDGITDKNTSIIRILFKQTIGSLKFVFESSKRIFKFVMSISRVEDPIQFRNNIPTTQQELYDAYLDMRFDVETQRNQILYHRSWKVLRRILSNLAYGMLRRRRIQNSGLTAKASWAYRWYRREAIDDGIALSLLVYEDNQKTLRFFHQSLHAYFALPHIITAIQNSKFDLFTPLSWPSIFLPKISANIIRQIGDLGDAAEIAVPALIEMLSTSNLEMREVVVDALARIGDVGIDHLVKAIKSTNPSIRLGAKIALSEIGSGNAPQVLASMKALDFDTAELEICRLIWIDLNSPPVLKLIVDDLSNEKYPALASINAAGALNSTILLPIIYSILQNAQRIYSETTVQINNAQKTINEYKQFVSQRRDLSEQSTICEFYKCKPTAKLRNDIRAVLHLLPPEYRTDLNINSNTLYNLQFSLKQMGDRHSYNERLLLLSIEVLGYLGSSSSVEKIVQVITDDSLKNQEKYKLTAVIALGHIGSLNIISPLKQLLSDEQHEETIVAAINALSRTRDKSLKDVFIGYRDTTNSSRRIVLEAEKAFDRISYYDPARYIVALGDKSNNGNVHRNAARELMNIGISAVPELVEALQSNNEWIVEGAAWTLGRIGDDEAIKPLEHLLHTTRSKFVLRAVRESLDLLTARSQEQ
ncbi:MAG: hypothetical protein CL607_15755 [Anaerolineaceae bacterium]|nr:hypothetical protein [Anaerolineaceae bacterium]